MNLEKIAIAVAKADAKEGCTDALLNSEGYMAKAREIAQAALTAMLEGFGGDGVTEGDREAAGKFIAPSDGDFDELAGLFSRHRQLSAAAERARIVAGVRACQLSSAIPEDPAQIVRELADAIERGEV